ncbi:nucleotidyltransferase family protein [Thiohalophilus thiocyanatoxydans]|uniref:Molybdenum cofactor cytidylyltransferase n=1 Tax=Thiohalophilus thiocyanatoxydans TaxID=381308 RepID=A0A4V3H435_9GAMM|nr:nucleotidyltransferase family protein [Thiohalophilus thiocyanatoxydans]TDY01635.1 molybdenum cofactor cytidylyltransferase [Thiohalophilus thiocyanatoxydans]
MSPVTGILLAAGQSRRFGRNKLLQPLSNQVPMVAQAARKLKAVLPESVAVVGPDDPRTAELLEAEGLQVVINPQPETGMGCSLACAVRASHDAPGWLITLGDMPWIDKQTTRAIATALQLPRDIIAPLYGDRRGHPVGFGSAYVRDLLALDGDHGARPILNANPQHLTLVSVNDPGVLRDVDYPEDMSSSEF